VDFVHDRRENLFLEPFFLMKKMHNSSSHQQTRGQIVYLENPWNPRIPKAKNRVRNPVVFFYESTRGISRRTRAFNYFPLHCLPWWVTKVTQAARQNASSSRELERAFPDEGYVAIILPHIARSPLTESNSAAAAALTQHQQRHIRPSTLRHNGAFHLYMGIFD
jgi:hypothetical protein